MLRLAAAAFILSFAGAHADTLDLYDDAGAAMKVDTSAIDGCKMVFDSQGNAFEFCKLERIELRPQGSTRIRPGQAAAELQIVRWIGEHQVDRIVWQARQDVDALAFNDCILVELHARASHRRISCESEALQIYRFGFLIRYQPQN